MRHKLLATVAAIALVLAGCTTTTPTQDASGTYTQTALVVIPGKSTVFFIDQKSGAFFSSGLTNAQITGLDGKTIEASDLVSGNVVSLTGDGIMLDSWPGQYPGITLVEVIEEGSPDDIADYADLIDEVYVEPDPSEPPNAYVEYKTDLYATSTSALRLGYTWNWDQDGESVGVAVDAELPEQVDQEGLPLVKVEAPTEVTVSFDRWAESATVTRMSEDDLEVRETVQAVVDGGEVTLEVEPGWRYATDVVFDTETGSGTVTFVFLCPAV